uniref:Uncharacterized protein n=1 Tax=Avena sativa TaxID=4498 RepID=A0ACD5UY26_AVESA
MFDSIVVPSRRRSGGLWLMWNDEVQVSVHSFNYYVILAIVVVKSSNLQFGLVCIYGDPYHRNTSLIWDQVASFVYDDANMPIMCTSDMNELLYDMDKNSANVNHFYAQRVKKNWIKDGDRNTSFFHKAIAKRRRRNTILSIKDEHDIIQFMPDKISNTFVNYFRHIFASQNTNHGRPYLHTSLPTSSQDYTYSIPERKELWETLKDMKRNASPGLDGFNAEFYTATWDWIGDDVCMLMTF